MCKWFSEQELKGILRQTLRIATKDRKLWGAIINYILKEHGKEKEEFDISKMPLINLKRFKYSLLVFIP